MALNEEVTLRLKSLSKEQVLAIDALLEELTDEEKETILLDLRDGVINKDSLRIEESLETYRRKAEVDLEFYHRKLIGLILITLPLIFIGLALVLSILNMDDPTMLYKGVLEILFVIFNID